MCLSMNASKTPLFFTIVLALVLAACGSEDVSLHHRITQSADQLELQFDTADLIVTSVRLAAAEVEPGARVRVDVALGNQGSEAASQSQLRYMLSSDPTLDEGDRYLNYDGVDALEPGASASEYANIRVPESWSVGTAFLLVVADYRGDIDEAREDNNLYVVPFEVVSPKQVDDALLPDLLAHNASLSSSISAPGSLIEARVQVLNQGFAHSDASQLRYYLSSDASWGDDDRYLNYDRVGSLSSGEGEQESANLRIPAAVTPGAYFILFVTDAKAAVAESDEDNNVLALDFYVGDGPSLGLPDLAVATLGLDVTSLQPGGPLYATIEVQNQGTGLSVTTGVRYYLSTDDALSADDTLIGSDTIEPIGPQARRTEQARLVVHESTRVGNYWVLASVEPLIEQGEVVLENNFSRTALVLSKDRPDALLADLQMENIVLSAAAGVQGEQVSIALDVVNRGIVDAPRSRLKYYISTQSSYDASARYLNYDAVSELQPGAVSAETANLRVPAALPSGDYFILLVADDTDVVDERIESNNQRALPFGIGPEAVAALELEDEEAGSGPQADLVLEATLVPSGDAAPGERVGLSISVWNRGALRAEESRVKYYISRDPVYDVTDVYGGYDRVIALEPDQRTPEQGSPRVPRDAQGGLWYVLAVADANNAVDESEENNNVLAVPFIVDVDTPDAELPDLLVSRFTTDYERYQPNAQVDIQLEISNQGSLDASGSRLKLYWSKDELYDASDRFLDYRVLPELEVDGLFEIALRVRVPFEADFGAAYLIAVLDVEGQVSERFESNNVVPKVITVDALGKAEPTARDACPDYLTTDPLLDHTKSIGAMNVLHMGWANGKDYDGLACVLSHFAISALNEVESEAALMTLTYALEQRTGEDWDYHISPQEVGYGDSKEYYGFVWRVELVTFLGGVGFFDDPQDVIKRDPYGANFRLGAFDFTLVAFHQRNGGLISIRRDEAQYLTDIVTFFQDANGAEEDLLIGGDFNLPGNDHAFTAVGWEGVTYSVDHEQPTSIADGGLRNSFDNFFYQSHLLTELTGAGVLDFTRGNHAELRRSVSDHIPVWVQVDTSVDLD